LVEVDKLLTTTWSLNETDRWLGAIRRRSTA